MRSPIIQWYPGHIAKAEKQLSQNLDKVDLIIEVRDARIPKATSHPNLQKWIHGRHHLLVINRRDMISAEARKAWQQWFQENTQRPLWCDSKAGKGINQILQAAIEKGNDLNERRKQKGMLTRPVRALTLGFPNVGKSALINRLVKRKVVASARRAGVTRSLRWIRMGAALDLLDAPGVLPPRLDNQEAALLLALCDDIGQAAYQVESVAIEFLKLLKKLEIKASSGIQPDLLEKKYGVALLKDEYEWLANASQRHTSNDTNRMAQRLLDDFRKSFLGKISLELPA